MGEKWSRRLVRGTAAFCLAAWELLFISAVMQMGLALPMAYYFHRATTIGLPSNIDRRALDAVDDARRRRRARLWVYVSPWLAKVPVLRHHVRAQWNHRNRARTRALRLADLRVPMPSMLVIALAAAALVLAMWAARRRRVFAISGLAAILLASLALAFIPATPRTPSRSPGGDLDRRG